MCIYLVLIEKQINEPVIHIARTSLRNKHLFGTRVHLFKSEFFKQASDIFPPSPVAADHQPGLKQLAHDIESGLSEIEMMGKGTSSFPNLASHTLQISTAIGKQATSFWHFLGCSNHDICWSRRNGTCLYMFIVYCNMDLFFGRFLPAISKQKQMFWSHKNFEDKMSHLLLMS